MHTNAAAHKWWRSLGWSAVFRAVGLSIFRLVVWLWLFSADGPPWRAVSLVAVQALAALVGIGWYLPRARTERRSTRQAGAGALARAGGVGVASELFGQEKGAFTGAALQVAPPRERLRPPSGACRAAPPVCSPARLVPLYPQLNTNPYLARKRSGGTWAGTAPAWGVCR
jgi:hypothetical protein